MRHNPNTLARTLAAAVSAAVVALALPADLAAQEYRGTVRTAADGLPVSGAGIVALDERGREQARSETDSVGLFVLAVPRPGNYRLSVQRTGYASFTANPVPVEAGEVVRIEVRLSEDVVALDPIQVVSRRRDPLGPLADFYDRVDLYGRTGTGQFLTREQIEARNAGEVRHLLEFGLGLRYDGQVPGITRGGNCVPAFFLDGLRVDGPELNNVNPAILEGVEVYRGIAQMPATFQDPAGCGSVLLWTQRGEGSISRPLTWRRLGIFIGAIGLILGLSAL